MSIYLPKEEGVLKLTPPQEKDVVIKQATTKEEKERVYRFRYQIYVEEMRYKLSEADHKKNSSMMN